MDFDENEVGQNLGRYQRNLRRLQEQAGDQRIRREYLTQQYQQGNIGADELEREFNEPTYGRIMPPSVARSLQQATPESTRQRLEGAVTTGTYAPLALTAAGAAPTAGATMRALGSFFRRPPANASYYTAGSQELPLLERLRMVQAARTPVRPGVGGPTTPLYPLTTAGTLAASTLPIMYNEGVPGYPFGSRSAQASQPQMPQMPPPAYPKPVRRPAAAAAPAARPEAISSATSTSGPSSRELYEEYNRNPDNMAAYWRAVDAQKEGRAEGGAVDRASRLAKAKGAPCHTGIINMAVGGRTDHLPMNVLSNSYVLPADIVSGLGEGNTLAGSKILDQMFHMGPFGTKIPAGGGSPRFPQHQRPATEQMQPPKYSARGGTIRKDHTPVQIIAAGGEYVVPPEVVEKLGEGDMDAGHEYLDNFVKFVRHETAKTLNKLPPPRKD
jgi:hypothetical protein